MTLKIVGAGLPRTATMSLKKGLENLFGGPCYHMTAIPGFPFNLGDQWMKAFAGGEPDWHVVFKGYHAAVDWPASLYWEKLHKTYPDALVLLSVRDSADVWYESLNSTILALMSRPLPPEVEVTTPPSRMFEIFTQSKKWQDATLLKSCYERHNDHVRKSVRKDRLLEWRAKDGYAPICKALGLPVPKEEFPHVNRREEWGLGAPAGGKG